MSYNIKIYDSKWKVVDTLELNNDIFNDANINKDLIHELVLLQQANGRQGNAHTKNRSEVKHSGRKLMKQKWNGRGRQGDAAMPTRRWWGTTFWPTNAANWTKSMNRKQRKLALLGSVLLKIQKGNVLWLTWFDLSEVKTKDAQNVFNTLSFNNQKNLIILSEKDDKITKSIRNIDNVKYIYIDYLNPADLFSHKNVIFLWNASSKLQEIFA